MTTSPKALYEAYVKDRASYENAADRYAEVLDSIAELMPMPPRSIDVRAKNALSLYKKQQDRRYPNPWADCGDLIGARVVVALSSDKDRVLIALRQAHEEGVLGLIAVDDKELTRHPKQLTYGGLHAQVQLPNIRNASGHLISCEIQIRTIAEHTWAETEHEYIYKGPQAIPDKTRRIFARLLALVELLDHELDRGVASVSELESFARLRLAKLLEKEFTKLSSGSFSTVLVHEAVDTICTLELYEMTDLIEVVQAYISSQKDSIVRLLNAHGPSAPSFDVDSDWVISQPEALLYLALLENNAYGLGVKLRDTDLYEIVRPLALWTNASGFLRQD